MSLSGVPMAQAYEMKPRVARFHYFAAAAIGGPCQPYLCAPKVGQFTCTRLLADVIADKIGGFTQPNLATNAHSKVVELILKSAKLPPPMGATLSEPNASFWEFYCSLVIRATALISLVAGDRSVLV